MWEYDCIQIPNEPGAIKAALNERAKAGWEVVHMEYLSHPFVEVTQRRSIGGCVALDLLGSVR